MQGANVKICKVIAVVIVNIHSFIHIRLLKNIAMTERIYAASVACRIG